MSRDLSNRVSTNAELGAIEPILLLLIVLANNNRLEANSVPNFGLYFRFCKFVPLQTQDIESP